MSLSLPDRPNLEQLRKQAKDLLKAHKRGDASACRILRRLGRFAASSDEEILKAKVALSEAQHALAREYGFKNWPALVRRIRKSAPPGQPTSLHNVIVENVAKSGTFGMLIHRSGGRCKCALCDKPATTHVTDRSEGRMVERHYCAKHAKKEVMVSVGGKKLRLITAPVKYAVTVSLTQDQLDREEAVRVTLPDGSVAQSPFRRGDKHGSVISVGPRRWAATGRIVPGQKYCVRFALHIIPPPAQP